MTSNIIIRDITKNEYQAIGELMVKVYAELDGFPKPDEQPAYYQMLANIGQLSEKPQTQVLVALSAEEQLLGGVVYFSDMAQYGSGGSATKEQNASGIRLLGVSPASRGLGVGRALTEYCIELAKAKSHAQVILHTTGAMKTAWSLYERMGFARSPDLDFMQQELPVFGFRLRM